MFLDWFWMMATKQESFVWEIIASGLAEVSGLGGDQKMVMRDLDGFPKRLMMRSTQEVW